MSDHAPEPAIYQTLPQPDPLKVALLCRSLGKRCGVGEYTSLLANRLGAVAVASAGELPMDADVVLIQYEPSFYPETSDIINEVSLVSPKTVVVVDAHYIFPEVVEELKWHAIVAMKRDILPGTIHLPLCLETAAEQSEALPPPSEIHLGTFGFAFPAKRYERVIELANRLGVRCTVLAAHNNSTDWQSDLSTKYLADLKKLAGPTVEIVEDYLPMDAVMRRLASCSHLVSCMDDNGAQSASLRSMAAVGRPLISVDTEPARSVGAITVDSIETISREFLENTTDTPEPYDGIIQYRELIQRLAWAKGVAIQIQHSDSIYFDDAIQMERIDWLRDRSTGRAIDIGIGNGFSTNRMRSVAGAEIRADRVAYASLRYPHIDFRVIDGKAQVLAGYDTIIFGEIVEHMTLAEAKEMIRLWSETKPERILVTTPNAGKVDYDHDLVHNPEHVWEPTDENVKQLVPKGYDAEITTSRNGDFILMDIARVALPNRSARGGAAPVAVQVAPKGK